MKKSQEEFEKRKNILLRYKLTLEEKLNKAIDKYHSIETSEIDKKETRLKVAKKIISNRKNALEQVEGQLEFLRPSSEKDMEYRLRQYDEFSKKMKDLLPEDLLLRFHGCPIYTARNIIASGEISSSVDRLGVETSYDTEGQISVTTKDTLDTTIQGYTDLSEKFLPAGCVFVLLPKDEKDAKLGASMLMENINFKKEPNRLYGIITTPENIEKVSQWAKVSGIDLNKIHDFDEFAKSFEKQKDDRKTHKPSRNYVAQDDPEIQISSNFINYTEFQRTDNGIAQTEKRKSPLLNEEKQVIGESEEIEEYDYATGVTTRNRYETIEGENGLFSVDTRTVSRGESFSVCSKMSVFNEISKSQEKSEYTRDEFGNETYTYMENGQIGQKISKTARGTTIDIFKDGQPYATYEYDENGKAIIPMGKMEQLPEDYVEYSFKATIPEYSEISYQESKPIVDTQRLGKETLDIQKDTSRIDEVEQQINAQMREQTQQSFRKSMRFDVNSNEYAQETLRKFTQDLENGTLDNEDNKKKDDYKVEKGDDDYIM